MKTLVVAPNTTLRDQIFTSLLHNVNGCSVKKIAKVSDYKNLNIDDCDIVVTNQHQLLKLAMHLRQEHNKNVYVFGTIVLDEFHKLLTPTMFESLLLFSPKYLVGLTATPFTTNGTDVIFKWFFPKPIFCTTNTFFIYITMNSKQYVEISKHYTQTISNQCGNLMRNRLLSKIAMWFRRYWKILVASKRIEQAEFFHRSIENSYLFTGQRQRPPVDNDIIVATFQKVTEGFDFPNLRMLMLASNMKDYFVQVAGRVIREPMKPGIIFDLYETPFIHARKDCVRQLLKRNTVFHVTAGIKRVDGRNRLDILNAGIVNYLIDVYCDKKKFDESQMLHKMPQMKTISSAADVDFMFRE
jgi:superfamily II DNA or RNA helicase